ncbi:putative G-protein coupled receptor 19 [Babylonia areolata]|uniref:putative G-protein coupled receptor 19 n=1 Tax=Babylonia areolata TaxID=304850 RepID=UPI003FD54312
MATQDSSSALLVVEIVTLTLLWALSVVGNLLVCLVVNRSRRIQSTTNYFVVSLALADLCLSLVCVPFVVARLIAGSWKVGQFLCKLVRFTQTAAPSAVALVMVCICVDRFYTILYPLSFKVTRGTAKRMIVGAWTTAVVLSSLCFYFYDVVTITRVAQEDGNNIVGGSGSGSSGGGGGGVLGSGPASKNLVAGVAEEEEEELELCPTYVVLTFLLLFAMPLLVSAVLYGRVMRHIWQAQQQQQQRRGCSRRRPREEGCGGSNPVPRAKVKMVRMLVLLTASTLLLLAPLYGVQLGYCFSPGRLLDGRVFVFAFCCLAGTAASKPLIYLRCNSNFRRGCKEVFCMSAMRCYRSHTYTITSASALGKKNHVGVLTTANSSGGTSGGLGDPSHVQACHDSPLQAFNRAWHVERAAWPLNGATAAPTTYV